MSKKVDVKKLRIGMYVSELDRPWLETSFPFQGFFLESNGDILAVQQSCEHVYIDTLRGIDEEPEPPAAVAAAPVAQPLRKPAPPYVVPVEQEIEIAQVARTRARQYIDHIFTDVQAGRRPDLGDVREVVSDLVASIVRNPNAQLCLTQLKNRDEYTAQHSVNVCVLTLTFGRHLGMPEKELALLGMGALLHDIGKLRTPLEILNKPGPLDKDEFEIMKQHPSIGRGILGEARGMPEAVIDIAHCHHERLQGHGYPNALQGDSISDWSKLVAIVDVYDAITSDRAYHNGLSATQALGRMYAWKKRDFDPLLLEQFIQCIGVYPVGAVVELSSGEVGIVISTNPQARLRPKLLLVRDEAKRPYFPPRVEDLAQRLQSGAPTGVIKRVLEPHEIGADIMPHLRELAQITARKS